MGNENLHRGFIDELSAFFFVKDFSHISILGLRVFSHSVNVIFASILLLFFYAVHQLKLLQGETNSLEWTLVEEVHPFLMSSDHQ